MKAIATVIGGTLQFDKPVELPDQTKVEVEITPVEDWRERLLTGLAKLEELSKTMPIGSGGRRYSRDELYDRG
jgi:hypothetical protein